MQALLSVRGVPALGSPRASVRARCSAPRAGSLVLLDERRRRGERIVTQDRSNVNCAPGRAMGSRRHVLVRASDSNIASSETATPSSPADAINSGLALFSKGRVQHGIAPSPFQSILVPLTPQLVISMDMGCVPTAVIACGN